MKFEADGGHLPLSWLSLSLIGSDGEIMTSLDSV